jgi:hypothetical protein
MTRSPAPTSGEVTENEGIPPQNSTSRYPPRQTVAGLLRFEQGRVR